MEGFTLLLCQNRPIYPQPVDKPVDNYLKSVDKKPLRTHLYMLDTIMTIIMTTIN